MRLKGLLATFLFLLSLSAIAEESKGQKQKPMELAPRPQLLYVNDPGYFFTTEFLFWQVLSGPSSQFCITKDFATWEDASHTFEDGLAGELQKQDYNWNPGFRFQLGYELPYHDSWEILGQYTWYYTSGRTVANLPGTTGDPVDDLASLYPTAFSTGPTATYAMTSKVRLLYQIGDVSLQKHFGVAPFLSLCLNADVRAGWINQSWTLISYSLASEKATNRLGWNFWGVGPGLGLDSDWYCNSDWTFFMNGNISLLTGVHTTHLKTTSTGGELNSLFSRIRPRDTRIVPHTQFDFGVSWNHHFKDRLRFLKLYAAYELNYLFNLVETYRYNDTGSNSPSSDKSFSVETDPLQLFGVTLGANLAF